MTDPGGLVGHAKKLHSRAMGTRPGRAWQRYNDQRGGLLAGGIAYSALFSVGAALVVGFTVLGAVLGGNRSLTDRVVTAVDEQLPGLLDVGADGGMVPPEELFGTDFTSWAGIIALVVALYSGLGWLDGVRQGVRAVFGCAKDETFIAVKKLKDVGVLATLGLAIVLNAVLSLVVNAAAGWLLGLAGLDGSAAGKLLLRALAVLAVFVVDAAIFMVLLRVLSGLRLPWRELRSGAIVGAVGVGLLKIFGGLLLGRAGGSNPLLAGSAVLVGLLLWINLLSRVTLLAAAWTATGPAGLARPVAPGAGLATSARVPEVALPTYGRRATDRTTLVAGAVLGAMALTGVRAVRDAARSVSDLVRSSPTD